MGVVRYWCGEHMCQSVRGEAWKWLCSVILEGDGLVEFGNGFTRVRCVFFFCVCECTCCFIHV